jgi:hypothetical protein
MCTTKGITNKEPAATSNADNSASPKAINAIPLPSSLNGPSAKVPPTEKVRRAKETLVIDSDDWIKVVGTKWKTFGLRSTPAKI